MIEEILIVLWLFLPAGTANMAAASSAKIKALSFLSIPVDMGKTFRGKRLLGTNKTVRGFIMGTLAAAIVACAMRWIYELAGLESIAVIDYDSFYPGLFGGLIGFGALVGDAVESFFKRQIGIQPGNPWFPFDQIDFIFGSFLFGSLYLDFSFTQFVGLLVIFFFGHLVSKYVGYHIGLDDKPF